MELARGGRSTPLGQGSAAQGCRSLTTKACNSDHRFRDDRPKAGWRKLGRPGRGGPKTQELGGRGSSNRHRWHRPVLLVPVSRVARRAVACHDWLMDELAHSGQEHATPEPAVLTLGEVPGSLRRIDEPLLTHEQVRARRRNRMRLLFVIVPALLLTGATLAIVMLSGSTPDPVKPLSLPTGYSSSTDGYFAFAFPTKWSTNNIYSDDTGDDDLSGSTGWVAEHIGVRNTPPVRGETPPSSLQAFGMDLPTPFHLVGGTAVTVPGAVALRYTMTRPGGFEATVIDAWRPTVDAEIWLVVDADAATTETIVTSLNT